MYQSLGTRAPCSQYQSKVKNACIQPKTCFTYLVWSFQMITV